MCADARRAARARIGVRAGRAEARPTCDSRERGWAGTAYRPLPAAFFDRIVSESLKLPARLWRDVFKRLLEHDGAADLQAFAAPA
jgi:hypothetical protein